MKCVVKLDSSKLVLWLNDTIALTCMVKLQLAKWPEDSENQILIESGFTRSKVYK